MDYVAKRDHSEKELRQKLERSYGPAVINQAIDWALQQKWFTSSDMLKEDLAIQLHHRGKGLDFINKKLEEKGLAPVESDFNSELAKAQKLMLAKWNASNFGGLSFADSQKLKAKIVRFLAARGFEMEIIEHILKIELKAGALSHEEF